MMKKIDKRVEATKQKLKNALLELRQQKSIEDINITLVCEKAKVNRNTFYSHYSSLSDLSGEIDEEFLEFFSKEILSSMNETAASSLDEFLVCLLSAIKKNLAICSVLFNDKSEANIIIQLVEKLYPEAVNLWKENMLEINLAEAMLLYNYIVGGTMRILGFWVKSGCKEEIDSLAHLLSRLISEGMNGFTVSN